MKSLVLTIFPKFLLIILSISLSLWIANFYLNLTGYQNHTFVWGWANELEADTPHPSAMFSLDPELIYRPNTNVVQSNSTLGPVLYDQDGFRPTGKVLIGPEVKTIVAIGDSFTWGHNLRSDQTYPFFLEAELRRQGWAVNVKNAGVNGYGSDQQLLYLRDYILPNTKPDVVVWNVNVNDVEDNAAACLFVPKGESFQQVSAVRNTSFIQGFIAKHLPVSIRRTKIANLMLYYIAPGWERQTLGCDSTFDPTTFLSSHQSRKFSFLMKEMNRLSQEHNFKLLVTLMPNQYYVDPQYDNTERWVQLNIDLAQTLKTETSAFLPLSPIAATYVGSGSAVLAKREPTSTLAQVLGASSLNASSVQTVTLDEFFMDEGPDARGHWHLTEKGNRLMGYIVANYVQEWLR